MKTAETRAFSRMSGKSIGAVSVLVLMAAWFLTGTVSFGQEAPKRPRIGLCLAGGGARGGAHIGVLQVLEELRVPVDCIAGTSIGSIVGGLYAAGMSPAEMDSVLGSIDWHALFDDSPPRQLINFRRKEEDRLPYFKFELGLGRNGVKLPAGLVAGSKLIFLLRELTLPAAGIDDFDELPIPFRAVAASLDDGSEVVIGHGSLADAMRASMAIPGAFNPHVIDGRTLVDGGLLRNVPYDVVKSMGADIVIVVDVGKPLSELGQDLTVANVLMQTLEVSVVANSRESLAAVTDRDLVLVPDLPGIGVESFDRITEASVRGEEMARPHSEWLRRLSLSEAEYEVWRAGVRAAYDRGEVLVGDVRVDSPSRIDSRRVAMQVQTQPGTQLDMRVLAEDVSRVYRLGEFEIVDFALEPSVDPSAQDLLIRTQDKRWGPNYLRLGLALEGHLDGEARFLVLAHHRMSSINRLGAEWRNQVTLGNRLGLDTDFFQPLTMNGRFFVAPRLHGSLDKRQRWVESDLSAIVDAKRYWGRLDVGLAMSHWGELKLGAYRGETTASDDNQFLDENETLGGWRGELVFDQLDKLDFPRRGWLGHAEGVLSRGALGATTDYDRLFVKYRGATTGGRFTMIGQLEGGTSFNTELPFHDRFELGGFNRLSGFEPGRLFGDDYALLVAGLQMHIATLSPSLGGNLFLGVNAETGQVWSYADKKAFEDLILGSTVYLGVESLLGPFYAGYGWAEGGNHTVYMLLGRVHQ